MKFLNVTGNDGSASGWIKSSFCTNGTCVEIEVVGKVRVADSKVPAEDRKVLEVDFDVWDEFLESVSPATKDLKVKDLKVKARDDGSYLVSNGEVDLVYTSEEWQDFVAGVKAGQLRPEVNFK